MNARSLIFIICTSISFFAIHYYYNSNQEKELKEWHKEKETEMVDLLSREERQANVSAQDLNETVFYSDKEGQNFYSVGTEIDGAYLLLSTKDYPKSLYIQNGRTTKEVFLLAEASKNSPAVFGQSPPLFQSPSFSDNDIFYILCPSCKKGENISYAKQEQGRVYLHPQINNDGIAFVKRNGKFIPVAVFYNQSKRFRPLKDFFSVREFISQERSSTVSRQALDEEFYVLENEYQQLVFSTAGGALSEINLPLKTNKSSKSLVNPIKFDRIMERDYPENDLFPQNAYFAIKNGEKVQIAKGKLGGYYPLIRRSTYHKNGTEKKKISPRYYAYNIISDDLEVENLIYKVKRFEKDLIEFEANQPYRKITKTYTLNKNKAPYMFDLVVNIDGEDSGLYLSSGIPEVELLSGNSVPVLKYRMTNSGKSKVTSISLPSNLSIDQSVYPDWICNSNGFLGMILDPQTDTKPGFLSEKVEGINAPTRLSLIDAQYDLYPVEKFPGYLYSLPIKKGTTDFLLFSGPFQDGLLKRLDQIFSVPIENYNPDYISAKSDHGWFSFISEPFGKFLFFLMEIFYKITSSWGISIILLTIALRLMLYPLNAWSIRANKNMQAMAPKIKEIQEKYKKDPKRLQMETMKIYREKGGSPFVGCLPMLIQLPFLFGMFNLLKSTFELRGASFIPGWINNLAAPDVLFSWSYPIPMIGTEFHLLPLLVGLLMYWSQKMTMAASSNAPAKGSDQAKQQKMMSFLPIIMVIFFYNLPSGLNIYFISSTFLGMIQQKWTKSKNPPKR